MPEERLQCFQSATLSRRFGVVRLENSLPELLSGESALSDFAA